MSDLKEKREQAKMTQAQLAMRVGVSRQAISAFECGTFKPSIPTAKKIAEVLKFDWSEFYEGVC